MPSAVVFGRFVPQSATSRPKRGTQSRRSRQSSLVTAVFVPSFRSAFDMETGHDDSVFGDDESASDISPAEFWETWRVSTENIAPEPVHIAPEPVRNDVLSGQPTGAAKKGREALRESVAETKLKRSDLDYILQWNLPSRADAVIATQSIDETNLLLTDRRIRHMRRRAASHSAQDGSVLHEAFIRPPSAQLAEHARESHPLPGCTQNAHPNVVAASNGLASSDKPSSADKPAGRAATHSAAPSASAVLIVPRGVSAQPLPDRSANKPGGKLVGMVSPIAEEAQPRAQPEEADLDRHALRMAAVVGSKIELTESCPWRKVALVAAPKAECAAPVSPAAAPKAERATLFDVDAEVLRLAAYHVVLAAYFLPTNAPKAWVAATPPRWHQCFRAAQVDSFLPTVAAACGTAVACASTEELVQEVRANLGITAAMHQAVISALKHGSIVLPNSASERIRQFLTSVLIDPMHRANALAAENQSLAAQIYEAMLCALYSNMPPHTPSAYAAMLSRHMLAAARALLSIAPAEHAPCEVRVLLHFYKASGCGSLLELLQHGVAMLTRLAPSEGSDGVADLKQRIALVVEERLSRYHSFFGHTHHIGNRSATNAGAASVADAADYLFHALALFTMLFLKMSLAQRTKCFSERPLPSFVIHADLRAATISGGLGLETEMQRIVFAAICTQFEARLGGMLKSATPSASLDESIAILVRFVRTWQELLARDLSKYEASFQPYLGRDDRTGPFTAKCWVECLVAELRRFNRQANEWLSRAIDSAIGYSEQWCESSSPVPPRLDEHLSAWLVENRVAGTAAAHAARAWIQTASFGDLRSLFDPSTASASANRAHVLAVPYDIVQLRARVSGCAARGIDDLKVKGMPPADGDCSWDATLRFEVLGDDESTSPPSLRPCASKVVRHTDGPVYVLRDGEARRLRVCIDVHTAGCQPTAVDNLVFGDAGCVGQYPADRPHRVQIFDELTARSCDERAPSVPLRCDKRDGSLAAEFAWPLHLSALSAHPPGGAPVPLRVVPVYFTIVGSCRTGSPRSWPVKALLAVLPFPVNVCMMHGALRSAFRSALACDDAASSALYRLFATEPEVQSTPIQSIHIVAPQHIAACTDNGVPQQVRSARGDGLVGVVEKRTASILVRCTTGGRYPQYIRNISAIHSYILSWRAAVVVGSGCAAAFVAAAVSIPRRCRLLTEENELSASSSANSLSIRSGNVSNANCS